MQPSLLDYQEPTSYATTMRKRRIEIVASVLEEYPIARDNQKELLMLVWIAELNGQAFIPTNIRRYCSSPSGIDRDRRRPHILAKYPRKEAKFEAYKEYKDEMSTRKPYYLQDRD